MPGLDRAFGVEMVPSALAALMVAVTMMLGGGGDLAPVSEFLLEAILAGLTVAWLFTVPEERLRAVPRGVWTIALLLVLVPVLQLLPLPPFLWHALPGRGVESGALQLVGAADSWRPLSLTPDRTVTALLAMIAAAVSLVMVAAQPRRDHALVLAAIVAVGLLSVGIGAGQLAGSGASKLRFYHSGLGYLIGFQRDHTSEADVLLVAMVATAALAADVIGRGRGGRRASHGSVLALAAVATGLLALGVILTASRAGMGLLPLAFLGQYLLLARWLHFERRHLWLLAALGVLLVVASGLLLAQNPTIEHALGRFRATTEVRPQIWTDAWYTARAYLPWGTGMGSFQPIFAANERLSVVTGQYINRAHDDYLELLIEAGVPGLAALGAIGFATLRGAARGWRRREATGPTICAMTGLAIVAIHSIIDYPLRTMAMAGLTASIVAMMLGACAPAAPEGSEHPA